MLRALAEDLLARAKLDLTECFIDGSFALANKEGLGAGKANRGMGTKIKVIADRDGLPIDLWTGSASPHETRFVEVTLTKRWVKELPVRLVGDKAYDSDKLDMLLDDMWGIEMIAPNRRNLKKTQYRRPLRRYKRRWKVERVFAWLFNKKRLVVRYERDWRNYLGMLHLACILLLLG